MIWGAHDPRWRTLAFELPPKLEPIATVRDLSKPAKPIEVWCPQCKASPGDRCATPLGAHRRRYEYARKEF